ncbi:uncharacterized protein Smp_200370 [Schistosoma mansoni]|uniref:uncharacterized protein n=1 Tax=Schistosoma mansoni TaxID=6183 RepID=UPI00022DC90A|nr:uncharacterized protein Smp_200370 [Schistosoma mansoni]|eukprot:XP_018647477.1 uncharacterized protein Smp_200370 [Schistosoma mansoni]
MISTMKILNSPQNPLRISKLSMNCLNLDRSFCKYHPFVADYYCPYIFIPIKFRSRSFVIHLLLKYIQ